MGGRALFLIGHGPDEEADDRGLPGREPGESRLRFSQSLHRRGDTDRRVRVRLRNCIYDFSGYTDIALGSAMLLGDQAAAELQPSLRGGEHRRFLAPLAHLSVELAARLSVLLAAGSAFEVEDLHVHEPDDHHGDRRPVAWSELEFRDLGRAARRWASSSCATCNRQIPQRKAEAAPAWWRYGSIVLTFHFVVFAWIFFRASSFETAMADPGRIASLTVSFANISAGPLA